MEQPPASALTVEQRFELLKIMGCHHWDRWHCEWLGAAEVYIVGGLATVDAYLAALPPES